MSPYLDILSIYNDERQRAQESDPFYSFAAQMDKAPSRVYPGRGFLENFASYAVPAAMGGVARYLGNQNMDERFGRVAQALQSIDAGASPEEQLAALKEQGLPAQYTMPLAAAIQEREQKAQDMRSEFELRDEFGARADERSFGNSMELARFNQGQQNQRAAASQAIARERLAAELSRARAEQVAAGQKERMRSAFIEQMTGRQDLEPGEAGPANRPQVPPISKEGLARILMNEDPAKVVKDEQDAMRKLETEISGRYQREKVIEHARVAKGYYNAMVDAYGDNSAAADINFLYGVGKVLDPGSAILANEMGIVTAAGNFPEWVRGMVSRAVNEVNENGKLSPATKLELLKVTKRQTDALQSQKSQVDDFYRETTSKRSNNRLSADRFLMGDFASEDYIPTGRTVGGKPVVIDIATGQEGVLE